jgi:hypothetical protein
MTNPEQFEMFMNIYDVTNKDHDTISFYDFYLHHSNWSFSKLLEILPENETIEFSFVGMEDEHGIYMSCSSGRPIKKQPDIATDLIQIFEFKGASQLLNTKLWRGYFPEHYEMRCGEEIRISNKKGFPRNAVLLVCPEDTLYHLIWRSKNIFPEMVDCFKTGITRLNEFICVQNGKIVAAFPEIENINSFIDYEFSKRVEMIGAESWQIFNNK